MRGGCGVDVGWMWGGCRVDVGWMWSGDAKKCPVRVSR